MLQSIIIYLLKVAVCSALLAAYYYIALRNKRFHYYNRFYILMTIVLSATLPLLHLQWFTFKSTSPQTIQLFNIINADGGEDFNLTGNVHLNQEQLVLPAFCCISAVMLIIFGYSILKIYRIKKQYPVNKTADFDFIDTDIQQAPFSFLKNIFWRNDISLQENTGKQILQHEITHIKQKHSWDKLFMQLLLCFYWMNPVYWLLQKELYLVHEFIADEEAVNKNDATAFAKMLLTSQYGKFQFLPAQSIFYSPIKRRLVMLTKSKRSQFSYVRRLLVLPLIAFVVCLFAFTVKNEKTSVTTRVSKSFKLIIDAGHGGSDNGTVGNGSYEKDITLKIAEKIKSLSANYGIDVLLTRDADKTLTPAERVAWINQQNANACISIHVNAIDGGNQDSKTSGMEVLISKNNDNGQIVKSQVLGYAVITNLMHHFNITPSLVQHQNSIYILQNSNVPSVLIECGYITNADDMSVLKDDSKIEHLAKRILESAVMFSNNKNIILPQKNANTSIDTSLPSKSNEVIKPLYVLDGKIIEKEKADKLDPNTIESINVLKDKNAIDKYGDKGKNGVVEITSKKS